MNKKQIKSIIFDLEKDNILNGIINKYSFFLFLIDEKEITLEYISYKNYDQVKSFFSKYKELFHFKIGKLDEKEFIIYFSKDLNKLSYFKKEFESYISGIISKTVDIGVMLGFPSCCIDNFDKYFYKHIFCNIPDITYDFIKLVVNNSKNFDKRLDIFGNRIISHTPCSFSCKKSIDLYNNTINYFKEYGLYNKQKVEDKYLEYLIFKSNDYLCKKGDIIKNMGKYYSKNNTSDFYFNKIYKEISSGNLNISDDIKDTIYIKFS